MIFLLLYTLALGVLGWYADTHPEHVERWADKIFRLR